MIPWMIVVTCVSGCGAGMPDLGANAYTTRRDCERALMQIAEDWKPPNSAYAFNCRPWPW